MPVNDREVIQDLWRKHKGYDERHDLAASEEEWAFLEALLNHYTYAGIRYQVIWNKGSQTEWFTGPDADEQSRLRQYSLRDAGFSSQRYKKQWMEVSEPNGWFRGNGDEPVDATEPKVLPDVRDFSVGTKVENAQRRIGMVTELHPDTQEVSVQWFDTKTVTKEHCEKLRIVEDTLEEALDKADQKYHSQMQE